MESMAHRKLSIIPWFFLFSPVAVGQPLADVLLKLRNPDYEVRFKSLSELSQLKDSRAIPDIERAIEEEAK